MKRMVKELIYMIATVVLLYVLISFVQVNMFNLDNPDMIGEYNFFVLLVRIGEMIGG